MRIAGKKSAGFSLVEVMIAVAIFSTGLGGFSLLLMLAIQETAASGLQTVAASQARSMSEFLRGLSTVSVESIRPASSPGCLAGGTCAPGQMAGAALFAWQRQLAVQIPGGGGTVCHDSTPDDGNRDDPSCDGSGGPVVKVFWSEPGSGGDKVLLERRSVTRVPPR